MFCLSFARPLFGHFLRRRRRMLSRLRAAASKVRSQLISSSHTRRVVAAAVVVVSLHLPLAAREPLPRARILTQQPADCEKVRGSSGGRRRIMSVSCAQLGSTRETNIQTCTEKSLAGEHSQAQAGAPLA